LTRPAGFGSKVVRAGAIALAMLVLAALAAGAAELTTAELTGTANNVTVEQGQTVTFQISLSATGTIRCAATPANPATAKVDTHYVIDPAGAVTSDTPSAAKPFYADTFCNVTWPGDPTPQAVTATVTTDIDTPLGDHAIRLHTIMTTPGGTGATLRDDTPTLVTFHVVEASDKTPPIVSCSGPTGTQGNAGWYTTEIAYSCVASDAQSGLANASDASFTLATTGDGADSTPSRTVKDKAGNSTTAGPFGPFNIDTVAPTVACGTPTGTHGDNGWFTSAVTVGCTASDATSGLADANDASFALSTTGEGWDSIGARTVPDVAGNATSTGSFGPFDVDLYDPTVTTSSPADGASIVLGSIAHASYTCTDTAQGSGIETCAGSTLDGGALDTSSVGPHTFSVTATDRSGRTTTVKHTYNVVYDFGDVGTPGGKSFGEAGRTIPVWFSLDGVSDPSAISSISSAASSCDGTTVSTSSPITMNGKLTYDGDRFKFLWKTDKSWGGTCRALLISLRDGTTHTIVFTLN
jgi:hypothetical protein